MAFETASKYPEKERVSPPSKTSRREFLRKVGTVAGGLILGGGGMAAALHKEGEKARNKKSAEQYVFSNEELIQEITEFQKRFPEAWEEKARERIIEGVQKMLAAEKPASADSDFSGFDTPGFTAGIIAGTFMAALKEFWGKKEHGKEPDRPLDEIAREKINSILMYGGAGGILQYLLEQHGNIVLGRGGVPQRQAERIGEWAFDALRAGLPAGTVAQASQDVRNTRDRKHEETMRDAKDSIEVLLTNFGKELEKRGIRGALEQWGAASVFALRGIAEFRAARRGS